MNRAERTVTVHEQIASCYDGASGHRVLSPVRSAHRLWEMAWLFDSALTVGHNGSVEDPKKALGCMRLGLGKRIPAGDAAMVCAEGGDAEAGVDLLARVISGEQKLTGEFKSHLGERSRSRYKALREAGLHPWQCEDPTLGYFERRVIVHESATRGREGTALGTAD